MKDEIIKYADSDTEYGWFEHAGVRYPYRALLWYVYGKNTGFQDKLPEYDPFCRSGMKMFNDSAFHSDVLLGAGYSLDESYPEGFWEAIHVLKQKHSKEFSCDFIVLANGIPKDRTFFKCRVYDITVPDEHEWNNHSIYCADKGTDFTKNCIVIPNAGIEFDLPAQHADVIICDVGGKLSHLSTVARESGKLLIQIDEATKRFNTFNSFYLDLDDNLIKAII